jgi:hypothetical protein
MSPVDFCWKLLVHMFDRLEISKSIDIGILKICDPEDSFLKL